MTTWEKGEETLACGSLAGLKPARYFFCCAA